MRRKYRPVDSGLGVIDDTIGWIIAGRTTLNTQTLLSGPSTYEANDHMRPY
jgi:hypothetical protein